MIALVIEKFHDYDSEIYRVDISKLNNANPVDLYVFNALAGSPNGVDEVSVTYYPREHGDDNDDPGISTDALLPVLVGPFDIVIWLDIQFE